MVTARRHALTAISHPARQLVGGMQWLWKSRMVPGRETARVVDVSAINVLIMAGGWVVWRRRQLISYWHVGLL